MPEEKTTIILSYDTQEKKRYAIDIVTKKLYSNEIKVKNRSSLIATLVTIFLFTTYPALATWIDSQGLNDLNIHVKQNLLLFGIILSAISFGICKKIVTYAYSSEDYFTKYYPVSEISDLEKKKRVRGKAKETMYALVSFTIISLIASIIMGLIFLSTSRFFHYIWAMYCFVVFGLLISSCKYLIVLSKIIKYFQEEC